MGVIHFDEEDEVDLLTECVRSYLNDFHNRFLGLLEPIVPSFAPPKVKAYLDSLDKLYAELERCSQQPGDDGPFEVSDRFASALRDAVIWTRLRVAQRVEERRSLTIDPDLLKKLDSELEPYTRLLNAQWFQRAEAKPVPQLTEFFPVQRVEADLVKEHGQPRAREFDEKFRILQAPGLFLHDLDRARRAAALRSVLVAVGFLDIDDFKSFNSERGNPYVDRHMLPTFMRRVEAHVFTRGYAYRYGGDEYVILLNNVTEEEALASMDRLRQGLAELSYEGIQRKATVSVGVVIVCPDCHLTGHEIEHAAERVKDFAKKSGRNRVATYNSPLIQDGDWRITAAPV
ncbi:MAG TPA: GGDEF domain-containing protein [Kofleriaceae bacterium]|jgi:diguanylate cyclase (GGDEF)-like protein